MRRIAFATSLFLAGCAGPIETRISSVGLVAIAPTHFTMEKDSNASGAAAQDLVVEALSQKGFSLAEPADHSLQVSVSARPSTVLPKITEAASSPVARKKLCATREFRLSMTLTRIADGAVAYRAHAAEYHCKQALSEVLPFLVDAAVRDLGSPRGDYVISRPRR